MVRFIRKRKYKALPDVIYEKLYDRIISGRLKPGQRITEPQIALEEGLSRAPVREALKRLAEEHLVTIVPRHGYFVSKLTPEEANDLFEIRKRLELLALEYAFGRFDPKKVRDLRDRVEQCLKLDGDRLGQKEPELDGQVHALINETSGSANVWELISKMWSRMQLFRIRGAMKPQRARASMELHVGTLDAILAGDRERAFRLFNDHLEMGRSYVLTRQGDTESE